MDRTKVSVCGHFVDFAEGVSEEIMRKFKGAPCEELEPLFSEAKGKGQGKFDPGFGSTMYGLTIQVSGIYLFDVYSYKR
ncbi:MAG: hypothetical protein ABID45_04690 [Patescibacteria group bacterium]